MPLDDIKLVVFDLFGVLLEEGHLVSNGLLRHLPGNLDRTRVKRLYEELNLDRISETGFWQGLGIDDFGEIRQRFLDEFSLDPGFGETIDAVAKDFQLSILSNLPAAWADYLVTRHCFAERFSPRVFSGHVAAKKPQHPIYRILFDQVDFAPAQSLFIDDRLENLQAARAIGMKTVYLKRENSDHPFQPDFQIENLIQLVKLLQVKGD
jgi:putative hydrolase of the HAD superfamily